VKVSHLLKSKDSMLQLFLLSVRKYNIFYFPKFFKRTIMKLFKIFTGLTPIIVSLGVSAAPPVATVKSLTTLGPGCPAASALVAVNPSGTDVSVGFKSFVISNAAAPSAQAQNCTLNFTLQAPPGFEVGIDQTVYSVNVAPNNPANVVLKGGAVLGLGNPIVQNKTITAAGSAMHNSGTSNTVWTACAAPTVFEDRIALVNTPNTTKPNAEIRLRQANYTLKYRTCQVPPPSGFTFQLTGNTATGYTAGGMCDVGHKIKISAKHPKYVPVPFNQSPPILASEFEDYCGGTQVIPKVPKTVPYVWAGPLPPSNVFGNVVFSNTPPLPMPPNSFVPGLWTFEAYQVEATAANPNLPRTTVKLPPITIN
jgi:Domain of unknown function (DUF4360)